ncbi:Zinc/iron permease [Parasitella parasitica]|nr:Zinc/iron permease [Parasitella parasitica]
MVIEASTEGWLMVIISSTACVVGASVVFLGGKVLESKQFLSGSMALGGGVLVFNSLYTLLPASHQKFDSNLLTFSCFFAGVIFTVGLSYFIQWCAPHAIHTCDPTSAVTSKDVGNTSINELVHGPELNDNDILEQEVEERDLMKPILPPTPPPLHNHHHRHHRHHHHLGDRDAEYGSITIHDEDLEQDTNDYFLIGIQTAIAICIHKFPEGLIMFISNESSSQLGLSVAAAMTIHNLIEGFLISLPLYYATGSRFAAFSYASILGGMSQPVGAVLGLLAIRNVDQEQENFLFGIIFGVVSGMMCLIAVQSMLPQAIRADATHRCVPLFFFIGIFLVGFSSLLQSI